MDLPLEKWQYVLFMAEAMYRLQLLRSAIDCSNLVLENILGHVPYVICQVAAAMSSMQGQFFSIYRKNCLKIKFRSQKII